MSDGSEAADCSFPKKYLPNGKAPSLLPYELFNASEDAEVLRKAVEADPIDRSAIVKVLTKRTFAQRMEIVDEYKKVHGVNIITILHIKLEDVLGDLIIALMLPHAQVYVLDIHHSLIGPGVDENILSEILCTLSNAEIQAFIRAYEKTWEVVFVEELQKKTKGKYRDLLVAICKTERDESMELNEEAAIVDAQALRDATGDNRKALFRDIFVHRSFVQLKLIFTEYKRLTGIDITATIEEHFSRYFKKALLATAYFVESPLIFYSKQLFKALRGISTHNRNIIRVLVTRSEIDMEAIKKEFEAQYDQSLAHALCEDSWDEFQDALLNMIGEIPGVEYRA